MEEHLNEIIKWSKATKGSKVLLAEEMSKEIGRGCTAIHRNEVGAWLNPDKSKRVPPNLGTGLVLIKVGRRLAGLKPAVILLVAFLTVISAASAGSRTPLTGRESGSRTASGRPGHLMNQPPRPEIQPEPRLSTASLGLTALTAVLGIQAGVVHHMTRRNRR